MKALSIVRTARVLQIVGIAALSSLVHAAPTAFSESQSEVEELYLSTTFDVTTTTQFSTTVLTDQGPDTHFGGSDYTFYESPNDPLYNDTLADATGISAEQLESTSALTYTIFNPSEFDESVSLFYDGDLRGSASVDDQLTQGASSSEEFDLYDSNSGQTINVGYLSENTVNSPDSGQQNMIVGRFVGQQVFPIEADYVIPGDQSLTITFYAHDYSFTQSDILATPEPASLLGLTIPALGFGLRRRKRNPAIGATPGTRSTVP